MRIGRYRHRPPPDPGIPLRLRNGPHPATVFCGLHDFHCNPGPCRRLSACPGTRKALDLTAFNCAPTLSVGTVDYPSDHRHAADSRRRPRCRAPGALPQGQADPAGRKGDPESLIGETARSISTIAATTGRAVDATRCFPFAPAELPPNALAILHRAAPSCNRRFP
jgi:hypothetical protein